MRCRLSLPVLLVALVAALLPAVPATATATTTAAAATHTAAPAVGQLVAELIVDGRASALDVHPFRPSRFAEGDAHPVSDLL